MKILGMSNELLAEISPLTEKEILINHIALGNNKTITGIHYSISDNGDRRCFCTLYGEDVVYDFSDAATFAFKGVII